jgi:hypothetical protein
MSTTEKPVIDARFIAGDKYMDGGGGVLERDGVGRWFAGLPSIPGFPQYERIWVLSDHHLDGVERGADGYWRDPTEQVKDQDQFTKSLAPQRNWR